MPLTEKGSEIMSAMKREYGESEGERVFYASKNAGKITGVDSAKLDRVSDAIVNLNDRMDRMKSRKDSASK